MPLLQPFCSRCKRRHRPDVPHWWGRYATDTTRQVLLTQGNVCWVCGGLATTTDHVVPRSLGGGDEPSNLRPACASCNARRGNEANPFEEEAEARPAGSALSPRWQ